MKNGDFPQSFFNENLPEATRVSGRCVEARILLYSTLSVSYPVTYDKVPIKIGHLHHHFGTEKPSFELFFRAI